MTTESTLRARSGFTLVELMIVVTIIGVLAVIGINSYRKHMNAARKSEVLAMFAELRAKEEAYRAEFSTYLSVGANEDDVWPHLLAAGEPVAKPFTAGAPTNWVSLGIAPGKAQLYCGYSVVAGVPSSLAGAGARGTTYYSNTAPNTPWWYATSYCDNDGNPAVNTLYMTSSDRDGVFEKNLNR